jgi:hypothetical protein
MHQRGYETAPGLALTLIQRFEWRQGDPVRGTSGKNALIGEVELQPARSPVMRLIGDYPHA